MAEFARAQDLERLLAGEHVFKVDVRGRALQVQVRMGDTENARVALADLSPDQRNRAAMRIALAALELEQDNPEEAAEALAPVLDGSAPALSTVGHASRRCCSTPRLTIGSATGARPRNRSRPRSRSPSPKA